MVLKDWHWKGTGIYQTAGNKPMNANTYLALLLCGIDCVRDS